MSLTLRESSSHHSLKKSLNLAVTQFSCHKKIRATRGNLQFSKNFLARLLLPQTDKLTEVVGGDGSLTAHYAAQLRKSSEHLLTRQKESKSKLLWLPGGMVRLALPRASTKGIYSWSCFRSQRQEGGPPASDRRSNVGSRPRGSVLEQIGQLKERIPAQGFRGGHHNGLMIMFTLGDIAQPDFLFDVHLWLPCSEVGQSLIILGAVGRQFLQTLSGQGDQEAKAGRDWLDGVWGC